MSYPLRMFLEQMDWALINWHLCHLDPATPPHIFRKWESIFNHFYAELRKYIHKSGEHPE
jgi:hypothetical protein